MELYHNDMAVCAQKVRLVLWEKNLKPIEHHLNLRAGDALRPEYLKLNPNGVVPTLVDRGKAIIESAIINEYLDDAYPEVPVRPADPLQRASMRLWTLLPDGGLHRTCGVMSFAVAFRHQMLALPKHELNKRLDETPDPIRREHMRETIEFGIEAPSAKKALRDYANFVERMAQQLARTTWLTGDEYSLADMSMLPYVCRLEHLDMAWLWQEKHPSLSEWLERCKKRRNFAAIDNYLDAHYLDIMQHAGSELKDRLRVLVAN